MGLQMLNGSMDLPMAAIFFIFWCIVFLRLLLLWNESESRSKKRCASAEGDDDDAPVPQHNPLYAYSCGKLRLSRHYPAMRCDAVNMVCSIIYDLL
mmetsp:Transcript_28490/g.52608  ORF Transcript_28490/g.52608 Transcript_28490/m.52608 type:complete len:96 (+) Transcript_28490:1312-1599(+)